MRTFIGLLSTASLLLALGCTQPKPTPTAKPPANTVTGDIKPGVIGAGHKGNPGGDEDTTPPAKKDTAPTPPEKKDNSPPAEKKEPPKK